MANAWQLFAVVAGAHFLALLSPGPDFFLIIRSALLHGWRPTATVCLGIAVANGIFIILAIGGLAALNPSGTLFQLLQAAGCFYLAYLGAALIHHARTGTASLHSSAITGTAVPPSWHRRFAMGFGSGILNPKNALFYASLFSLLAGKHMPSSVQWAYGLWMFAVVLGWDLLVCAGIGHPAVVAAMTRYNALIERITGVVLLLIAGGGLWLLAGALLTK